METIPIMEIIFMEAEIVEVKIVLAGVGEAEASNICGSAPLNTTVTQIVNVPAMIPLLLNNLLEEVMEGRSLIGSVTYTSVRRSVERLEASLAIKK